MIVTTFPKAVRVIEHTLIPLKDGTALAARIWLRLTQHNLYKKFLRCVTHVCRAQSLL